MSISKLDIRNFRSIVSFSHMVNDLNIFVGQNDEGKSNVLRALDLFFNHDKKTGYELDWGRDYCYFAPERKRKAPEILVELEITPPATFANRKPVVWRKVWRRQGLHTDTFWHRDGSEVSSQSKIGAFVRAIRFDYVPAIKGEEYFQTLMSSLHDMLEATVEEQIRAASGSFTETINENTQTILSEILDRLGLASTIDLPPNLRDLFAQLEFTSVSGEKSFSLRQRGDGIKVRHIPIVLRWLAQQANYLSAPGRPKAVTVWGYEEPENNLELRRCFDFARELVDESESIQTFVTTHSPAFYSVSRESDPERVRLFLVTKADSPPTTTAHQIATGDLSALDSSMGLLDFLEPHFREARQEIERLRDAVGAIHDTSKPTIFCEGPSDKALLEPAVRLFFPEHVNSIAIWHSANHGGGHTWVGDMMIAWSFRRPEATAVGLFDKDEAALETKRKAMEHVNPSAETRVYGVALSPGPELLYCYEHGVSVPFAIEELLPEDVWDLAEANGWLEERSNPVGLYKFDRTDVTFRDFFEEKLPAEHSRRIALNKVRMKYKKALCNHVIGLEDDDARRVLANLEPTIRECLARLGLLGDA